MSQKTHLWEKKKAWRSSLRSGERAVYLHCSQDLPTAGVFEFYCAQMWSFHSKSPSLWQRGALITLWGFRLISNFLIGFKSVLPGFEQWRGEREQHAGPMTCNDAVACRPPVWSSSKKVSVDLTSNNKYPLLSVGWLPELYLGNSTTSLDNMCSSTCDCFLTSHLREHSQRPCSPAPSV